MKKMAIFMIVLFPIVSFGFGPICADSYLGIKTQSSVTFEKPVNEKSEVYSKGVSPKAELLGERQFMVKDLSQAPAYKVESLVSFQKKDFEKDFYLEFGRRFLKPAITGNWFTRKFKTPHLISHHSNEILLGFDNNHSYLVVYNKPLNHYYRIDGTAFNEVVVRGADPKRPYDVLTEGVVFRFTDVGNQHLERIKESIDKREKFMTCTQAACTLLIEAGITIGHDALNIPDTTYEAIERIVKEGFFKDGKPIEVQVFRTDKRELSKFFSDAQEISKFEERIRQKNPLAFLAAIKYTAKTIYQWIFLKPLPPH